MHSNGKFISLKNIDFLPFFVVSNLYFHLGNREADNVQIHQIALDNCQAYMDYRELVVSQVYSQTKMNFCMFCRILQTKFARHLQNKHNMEEAIKEFTSMKPKSRARAKFIDAIRTKGDLMYNTTLEDNINKNPIVVRRPAL